MKNLFDKVTTDLKSLRGYYENLRLCGDFRCQYHEETKAMVAKYEKLINMAPPKLYTLYQMMYVEGFTQATIADLMHKSRVHITMLHKELKEFLVVKMKELKLI